MISTEDIMRWIKKEEYWKVYKVIIECTREHYSINEIEVFGGIKMRRVIIIESDDEDLVNLFVGKCDELKEKKPFDLNLDITHLKED